MSAPSPPTSRDDIPARSTKKGDQTKNKKAKPPDFIDPFSSPKLFPGCHKSCRFSVLLGICVALRFAVLAVLCCPWSVATFEILFSSDADPGVENTRKYNLDSLFSPEGGDKVDLFRLVASCLYLIDLFICFLASCLEYCTGNIKTILILCLSWLVFTLVNLAVAIWGAARFYLKHEEFITIFDVDLVLQPIIVLALLMNILWLKSLHRQGFIVFPRPLKNEAKFKYAARLGKEKNMKVLQRDPNYREIFGLDEGTEIESDPEDLEDPDDVENANFEQPSSASTTASRKSFTPSRQVEPYDQQQDPFYNVFYPPQDSTNPSATQSKDVQTQVRVKHSKVNQAGTTTEDSALDSSSSDSETGDNKTKKAADGGGKGDGQTIHIHVHSHKSKKKKKKKTKKKNKKKKSKKKKKKKHKHKHSS